MLVDRRTLFTLCGALIIPGISYGSLIRTPWQGEGPFYPDRIPEDTDNDLVKNGDNLVEADGKILILNGILVISWEIQRNTGMAKVCWHF